MLEYEPVGTRRTLCRLSGTDSVNKTTQKRVGGGHDTYPQ